jgi:pyruvate-formate lyase-activating enzyme
MTAPIFVDDMPLTPFLGNVKERITQALERLLGLPGEVSLRWHHIATEEDTQPLVALRLEIRTAVGRQFVLVTRDAVPEDAWQIGGVAVTVDAGADGRGLPCEEDVTQVVAGIRRRFEAGEADVADAKELLTALALRKEFPDQSDEVLFRRVERTTSGTVGMLRLGFRCNQDCFFCPQSRQWQGPDDDLLRTWLDEFGAGGIKILTISGGEPSTYSIFPELVHHAVNHWGMAVFVQTNAVQMAKDSYVTKMLDVGLHGMFVSFHSHLEEVSDRVTRAPRTWARTVKGIQNAQRAGIGVAINCCVEVNNYETLADHAQFIVDNFVTPFPDNPMVSVDYSQPGAYFHAELMEGSVMPYDVIEPYLAPALRILTDAGVPVNATGTCGFVPCMFRADPSLIPWRKRDRFDELDLENRRFTEACRGCAAQPYCVGVRGDVFNQFGDRGLVPYETLPEVEEYRDFDLFQLGLELLTRR